MHDTDMAGILYFAKQFRFAHDALEDFVHSFGYNFKNVFELNDFVFVIRHVEADYLLPVTLGDKLEIHVSIENIGTSSFTVKYDIYRDEILVGMAKTVHVTLTRTTRKKIPIPQEFKKHLEEHLVQTAE